MNRVFLFIAFALVVPVGPAHAQGNNYIMNGFVNCESGQVLLMPLIDSSYYPKKILFNEYPIENNRFHIAEFWAYPFIAKKNMLCPGQ